MSNVDQKIDQEDRVSITSRPPDLIYSQLKTRAWAFTINNPADTDEELIRNSGAQYYVFGREIGKENGTPHLQGYLYYKSQKAFKPLKKMIPRAHWEPRKGSHEQLRDYCMKEGNYEEGGVPPKTDTDRGQMEKQRYADALVAAKEGRFEDIPADLYTRHYNTYKKIHKEHQKVPDDIPEFDFHWYWGPTGTGKSRQARKENPGAYIKGPHKWWDGFVDQPCVIIDEWSPQHSYLAPDLKTWCDHYAFQTETKGSVGCIRPRKIVITSNYTMEECFSGRPELDPLRRRFKVTRFGPPEEEDTAPPSGPYMPDLLQI